MILAAAVDANVTSLTVSFFGILLLFMALIWDGLVRRHVLIPQFLGGGAFSVQDVWAVVLGLFGLVLGGALALFEALLLRYLFRACQGEAACVGGLLISTPWEGWLVLGICVANFGLGWLQMGDARRRMVVYGVWYHQETLARQVNGRLREQGLTALPRKQLYQLEEAILLLLHERDWLGPQFIPSFRGGKLTSPMAARPSAAAMTDEIIGELGDQDDQGVHAGPEVRRQAIRTLVEYFLAEAKRARQRSALTREWVGRSQLAKAFTYGEKWV